VLNTGWGIRDTHAGPSNLQYAPDNHVWGVVGYSGYDGTMNGKLIGTNFGKIDKPLRNFKVDGRQVDFTFPNVDPWSVSGKVADDGTITGIVFSIQGGTTVTFKKQTGG